jgi:hypothetical protein
LFLWERNFQTSSSSSSGGGAAENKDETDGRSFVQPYKEIANKVEKIVLRLILRIPPVQQQQQQQQKDDDKDEKENAGKVLCQPALDYLVQAVDDGNGIQNPTTMTKNLSRVGFLLGKALLLQRVLATMVDDNNNANANNGGLEMVVPAASEPPPNEVVEALLSICETLLCSALPMCHAPLMLASGAITTVTSTASSPPSACLLLVGTLISDSLQLMSRFLLLVETNIINDPATGSMREASASTTADFKRAQLHRLLIRWLAPSSSSSSDNKHDVLQHPLTRELATSLLYLHICGLGRIQIGIAFSSSSTNGRGPEVPLLMLVVKLWLDPRTGSGLRGNLASVLRLLLVPVAVSSNDGSTCTRIRDCVTDLVVDEFVRLVNPSLSSFSKKSKSSKSKSKKRKRAPSNRTFRWKVYTDIDLEAIGTVLAHLTHCSSSSSKLGDAVKLFCRQVQSQSRSGNGGIGIKSVELASLLLSPLASAFCKSGGDDAASSAHSWERFQQFTGVDISHFHAHVLSWPVNNVCQLLGDAKKKKTGDLYLTKKQAVLVASVFRFCARMCFELGRDGPSIQIQEIVRLLSLCTNSPFLPSGPGQRPQQEERYLLLVLFEAIVLLKNIGKAIPPDCPHAIIQVRALHYYSPTNSSSCTSYTLHSHNMFTHVYFRSRILH